jgi:hypothetical protein
MITFLFALKVLVVGLLIGGGLMLFSGPSSYEVRARGGFLYKMKSFTRFIGKFVIFIAMLLLPFALLKIVGLI